MTTMNRTQLHLYRFLGHLVKENYAKAQKNLSQVIENKIRARAGRAKVQMHIEKKMTLKSKPKMKQQKKTDKKGERVK